MATTVTSTVTSTTPILDCQQPFPKRRRWKAWLWWIVWFIVAIMLAQTPELTPHPSYWSRSVYILHLAFRTLTGTMEPPIGTPFWEILFLVWPAIYCVLIIHELGHFLAGLAVGFRANFVMVYPFRFSRTRTGWAVRRERLLSVSGAASMLPQSFEHVRGRLIVYVLGGPAINLLSFLILRAWLPRAILAQSQTLFFLEMLANMSLLLGALNLLPFQSRGFQSDGARVLMAVAEEPKFLRWFALIRLGTAGAEGTRPRDLDPELIRQAIALDDNSGDMMRAHLIAYSWAADREDVPAAAGHLEKCLALAGKLPKRLRCFLMLEAAVMNGWYREDAERAAQWLRVAGNARKQLPAVYRLRPEIAVAWAEGRHAEAQAKLQEVIDAVRKMPANYVRDSLELSMTEWQQKMSRRLEARSQAAAT